MKKKTVLTILGFGIATTFIATGFSAWVITSNMNATVEGNFQAYDVTDNGSLSVVLCDSTGTQVNSETLIFGKPATPDTFANPWFTFSNDMSTEVLDAYIKVTFTRNDTYPQAGVSFNVENKLQSRASSSDDYADYSATTYIASPTVTATTTGGAAYANNVLTFTADGSAIVKISYDWGSAFEGENPYNYYNALTLTDEVKTAAYNNVKGLYQLTGSNNDLLKFVVTVSSQE